jgi:GNAT superfamily N-acetyltransferase
MLMSPEDPGSAESNRTAGSNYDHPGLVERTYLSLLTPSQYRPGGPPTRPVALRRLPDDALEAWRALYARVGARWQWHDRDAWSDAQLAEWLARPTVQVHAVDAPPDTDAGMLELCRHDDGSVEVVYLGLVPELFGQRVGAWLLGEAVRLAWQLGATRVWLHTCTLDGPAALPNYLARGFTIDRTETYPAPPAAARAQSRGS